jgi:hypothetical protein
MPEYVKQGVCRRLYDILTGKDENPQDQRKFAKLSAEDRRNVLDIVRDTKPNLPAYRHETSAQSGGTQ